jgi:superfamily I DNA/RNA helicase
MIPDARALRTEDDLDALQSSLPVEAYEGLFLIAAGDTVSQILTARETRVDRTVDTEDFARALETAESQARFVVIDDPETMTAILNAPLIQWRVFLHPTQRKLASTDQKGPMRVLGGAGTGKTVLAMHRAKWLAEHRLKDGQKVLLTTFTRNLAQDIEENLKALCPPDVMKRIEVKNLDAWVASFLRRHQYDYRINYDRHKGPAADAWLNALSTADASLDLPKEFYEEELVNVILAQGIASRDEYRTAKRRGRGTILSRQKRDAIWPIFEEYRAGLSLRKLKEVDDAYRDAATLLSNSDGCYAAIVVDETQDFGPQALRLLRAMVPHGPNDLFLVGDGHQRIYSRNRASMGDCGIDIKGRGRKLYLNYRTTEEIRRKAVALLEGHEADDLDDGSDEVRRYKSVSRGPHPVVHDAASMEDALGLAVAAMQRATEAGHSACVLVPSRQDADRAVQSLQRAAMKPLLLGPDERDRADSHAPRVATMHRAKGLEFDEVVLISKPSASSDEVRVSEKRRLEYVALTRARRHATIIRLA